MYINSKMKSIVKIINIKQQITNKLKILNYKH